MESWTVKQLQRRNDGFTQGGKSNGLEKCTNFPSLPPSLSPSCSCGVSKNKSPMEGAQVSVNAKRRKAFYSLEFAGGWQALSQESGGSCLGEDVLEVHRAAPKASLGWDCPTVFNRTVEKSLVKAPSGACSSEGYWNSLKQFKQLTKGRHCLRVFVTVLKVLVCGIACCGQSLIQGLYLDNIRALVRHRTIWRRA